VISVLKGRTQGGPKEPPDTRKWRPCAFQQNSGPLEPPPRTQHASFAKPVRVCGDDLLALLWFNLNATQRLKIVLVPKLKLARACFHPKELGRFEFAQVVLRRQPTPNPTKEVNGHPVFY
jgi:hypothetical protein